jgi:uncharacterized membrane protein
MKRKFTVRQLTQFSLLLALEIILGVTPLGLIMIPPVAITLLHIPVIIGAIVMGPVVGMMLGGVFGIIAMIKATMVAVSPIDLMFSPFLSGNPIGSIFICLIARILLGLFAGLLFKALRPVSQNNIWSIGISALVATILHTIMVLGGLWLFFQAFPFITVFATIASLNGGLEVLAAALIAVPVCKPLLKYKV